jgi:hypothetical protein
LEDIETMKIILGVLIALSLVSCTTVHRPRALSPAERAIVAENCLPPLVLGIIPPEEPVQIGIANDKLISALTRTGLFEEIDYTSLLAHQPDLVLDVHTDRQVFYCLTGPGTLAILGLGLIPIPLYDEDHSHSFSFRQPAGSDSILTNLDQRSTRVVGWLVGPINILPNWSRRFDEYRHADRLKYEIISRQEEILGLIGKKDK